MASSKKKKGKGSRFNPALLFLAVVILAAAVGAVWYLAQTPKLLLTGKDHFKIGETVKLSDLVSGVENGTLVTEDLTLDSSRAGEQSVIVVLKSRAGREIQETVSVTFLESASSPVITAPDSLSYSGTEGESGAVFDPLAGVYAADESGKTYPVKVEGDYSLSEPGEYPLTYVALDQDGNRITKSVTLTVTVLKSPFDENGNMVDGVYQTAKDFELVIKDGIAYIDGIMIVNKSYSLPKNFSSTGDGTRTLRPETEAAWQEMVAAAPAEVRKNLRIRSGVRNIADQTVIFNNYVKSDGLENALTYSAKPGHSEHHTGLAMDITTSSTEECKKPEIAQVMTWLDENAYKYGFIKRYPEGKTDETGYIFEPWHYRYVGKELAETLYNKGDWITLEAYFGIDSEYKN